MNQRKSLAILPKLPNPMKAFAAPALPNPGRDAARTLQGFQGKGQGNIGRFSQRIRPIPVGEFGQFTTKFGEYGSWPA